MVASGLRQIYDDGGDDLPWFRMLMQIAHHHHAAFAAGVSVAPAGAASAVAEDWQSASPRGGEISVEGSRCLFSQHCVSGTGAATDCQCAVLVPPAALQSEKPQHVAPVNGWTADSYEQLPLVWVSAAAAVAAGASSIRDPPHESHEVLDELAKELPVQNRLVLTQFVPSNPQRQ